MRHDFHTSRDDLGKLRLRIFSYFSDFLCTKVCPVFRAEIELNGVDNHARASGLREARIFPVREIVIDSLELGVIFEKARFFFHLRGASRGETRERERHDY